MRSSRIAGISRAVGASLVTLLFAACAPPPSSAPSVSPVASNAARSTTVQIVSPPEQGFYGKRLDDGRIRILAHESVSDEALVTAKNKLETLLAYAPKLRANLEAAHHEVHVIGLRQFTSDLPEHRAQRGSLLDSGEIFDWHMIGGHIVGRLSSCTEATLLEVVGHRLYGTDACIHELAHAVEFVGMSAEARAKIVQAYDQSIADGHWKNEYAAKNVHEWFAEITRYYFRDEHLPPKFYDAKETKGRAWLCSSDQAACKLAADVYSGAFDPGVVDTEHVALRPASEESTLRSSRSSMSVRLTIENHGSQRIHVVWIDFDGKRDGRAGFARMWSVDPGATIELSSFTTHSFVITDDAGKGLCTFVVGGRDTLVDFNDACKTP